MSVYTSPGGSRFGTRMSGEVAELAESFRRNAAYHAARQMQPATEYPIPTSGRVRFYVVAADGVRTAEADVHDLDGGGHELSSVFRSAAGLMTALSEQTE